MIHSYKPFNFDLGETVDMIRDTVNSFAREQIAPRAEHIDQSNAFPNELWQQFGDLGLLGMTVSEEYGGSALGVTLNTLLPCKRSAVHPHRSV